MRRPQPLGPAPYRFGALLFACAAFAAPAVARAQQVTVFSDDFEATAGLDSTNWPSVSGNYSGSSSATGYRPGTYDGSPDGFESHFPSYSLYFRSDSSTSRQAITTSIDLSSYASATLTFVFRAEDKSGSDLLPFARGGIDSNNEEIILEYTTEARKVDPGWGQELWRSDSKTNYQWATITIALPSAALVQEFGLRWSQGHDETDADTWALDDVIITATASPEPGTWALFGSGVVGLGAVAARRRCRRSRVSAAAPPAS